MKKVYKEGHSNIIEIIWNTLAKGDDVTLIGFGKFHVTKREAGKGKNPRTGETMDIKACTTPKFKAGKNLKISLISNSTYVIF